MKEGFSNPDVTQKTIWVLGICLLAVILVYLLMKKPEGFSVVLNDEDMTLSYSSGESFQISYKDILSVAETQDLEFGNHVSGTETGNYKFGVWENDEFGEYNLCIYANVVRYIVVKTTRDTFVFNFESVAATDSFYIAFLELLQTK